MATAPGNTLRGGALISSTRPGIFETLFNGLVNSLKYSLSWSLNQSKIIWPVCALLFVLVIAFPGTLKLKENGPFSKKFGFALYLLVLAVLVFVSFVPTYYTGRRIPADRGLIFAVSLLCAIYFSIAVFFGFKLRDLIHYDEIKGLSLLTALFCVAALYFAISTPVNLARHYYYDNFPAQLDYAAKWDQSNADILEKVSKGEKEITTTKIKYGLADLETITIDPGNWVNLCAAQYYGVETIIAR